MPTSGGHCSPGSGGDLPTRPTVIADGKPVGVVSAPEWAATDDLHTLVDAGALGPRAPPGLLRVLLTRAVW